MDEKREKIGAWEEFGRDLADLWEGISTIVTTVIGIALILAILLGSLYGLVRFVKWAWEN